MSDPEKQKLIHQQLVLLLHALKCQKRENDDPSVKCSLPHCRIMKEVLNHMEVCKVGKECPVPHCSSSHQIIAHWKKCTRAECPVCSPLKPTNKSNNSNAQENVATANTSSAQPAQNTPNHVQSDAEKQKLIHQQLVLLLHAERCQKRENDDPSLKCSLPHCRTMKEVLNHMVDCKAGKECSVPHCSSSHQIIGHWKRCTRAECPVCSPLRSTHNTNNDEENVATANPSMMGVESNDPSQLLVSEIVDVLQSMSLHSPPQTSQDQIRSVEALFGAIDPNILALLSNDQPLNVSDKKEWHDSVTCDLRNHLTYKIVLAIFPVPDPIAMRDKRMQNLVAYAKKVEGDIYEKANSRSEYYHLLAEKIYKIQKELEEKRQKRKEQQMSLNYGATTSATAIALNQSQRIAYEQVNAATISSQVELLCGANDPNDSALFTINNPIDQRQPFSVTDITGWHNSVTHDLRNHLIHKLVTAMCPNMPSNALHDKPWNDLVAYAKKVEEEMYVKADSRAEYYNLLAEKIYEIQQELEMKRERRCEQQMELNHGATTLAMAIGLDQSVQTISEELKPDSDANNLNINTLNQPNQPPIQPDGPIKVEDEIDNDWMIIDNKQ